MTCKCGRQIETPIDPKPGDTIRCACNRVWSLRWVANPRSETDVYLAIEDATSQPPGLAASVDAILARIERRQ